MMADPQPTGKLHAKHKGDGEYNAVHVSSAKGTVVITICPVCHFIAEAHCLHESNKWDFNNQTLTCKLCGLDVT
jgi:hypothetical protein